MIRMLACLWLAATVVPELFARAFEVSVWRGETVAIRLPDYCEVGQSVEGVDFRLGTLEGVKFAPKPESLERCEVK